jgi:hypothetical protein
MSGCGCDSNHPTGVQWLVNNRVIDPSWLSADQTYPNVYVWFIPSSPVLPPYEAADLKRAGSYPQILVLNGGSKELYIPVRMVSPSEGPYYP